MQPNIEHTTLVDPTPQSSVQIEQGAKGPPRVTVKVYAPTAWAACELALGVYWATVERLANKDDEIDELPDHPDPLMQEVD